MSPLGPRPELQGLAAPFFEAARRGQLVFQRCPTCQRSFLPPVQACGCGNLRLEWVQSEGRGELWSFCRFHKSYFPQAVAQVPYVAAIVTLREGPRLYTNIEPRAAQPLSIGMPVVARFDDAGDGLVLVRFAPAHSSFDTPHGTAP